MQAQAIWPRRQEGVRYCPHGLGLVGTDVYARSPTLRNTKPPLKVLGFARVCIQAQARYDSTGSSVDWCNKLYSSIMSWPLHAGCVVFGGNREDGDVRTAASHTMSLKPSRTWRLEQEQRAHGHNGWVPMDPARDSESWRLPTDSPSGISVGATGLALLHQLDRC